jgi:hypothetical protein
MVVKLNFWTAMIYRDSLAITGKNKINNMSVYTHAALRRKNKDWLAWNQNNMSEWSTMSSFGLLLQFSSSYRHVTCSHHDIAEKLLTWH